MKNFSIGIGLAIIFVVVLIFVPAFNEEWISSRLDTTFEAFKGVTTKNYPDKVEREAAFAKVLTEKARIVKEDSWPLMACEATFTARNPGTIHRKDVRNTSCSWGSS